MCHEDCLVALKIFWLTKENRSELNKICHQLLFKKQNTWIKIKIWEFYTVAVTTKPTKSLES